MVSGLQLSVKRQQIDKATCRHYAYPVWVTVTGRKYRARCLGCGSMGPVVEEGPQAARQALRIRRRVYAAAAAPVIAPSASTGFSTLRTLPLY
jgi:hypothetical protein